MPKVNKDNLLKEAEAIILYFMTTYLSEEQIKKLSKNCLISEWLRDMKAYHRSNSGDMS